MLKNIQMQTGPSQKKGRLASPVSENYKDQISNQPSLLEQPEQHQFVDDHKIQKKYQPHWLFTLVCIMEILTISGSVLLLVVPQKFLKWVYLTYILFTLVRSAIWLGNSLFMVGLNKRLARLYFLLDNNCGIMLASDITYVFLNYRNSAEYVLGSIICYLILIFFLVGNFRVMMVSCKWSPCQVVSYKLVKVIEIIYFFIYGSYIIIHTDIQNSDLLLLWIFTASALWGGMYSTINALDESDHVVTRYILTNQ